MSCLAAAAILLWIYRTEMATGVVTRVLEREGLGPVALTVEDLGPGGARVRDVSLLGGAVRAHEIALDLSLGALLEGRMGAADIRGLQVTLDTRSGTLTLGGRPLGAAEDKGGGVALDGIPVDRLILDDAHLVIKTRGGDLDARFSTEFALSATKVEGAGLTLDLLLPLDGRTQPVRLAIPSLRVATEEGGLRVAVSGVAVEPKSLPWRAEGIDANAGWGPDGISVSLDAAILRNLQEPAMVHPVALSGEATMAGETIDFTLHGAVSPAGGSKLLDVTVKGSHDLDTSRGLASVDAAPVSFRPGGVQPGALFPAAAGTMSEVTGTLSLTGGLRWQAGSVSPELTARLAGIGFVTPAARFDGMTGAITFTSLLPPATPPGQRLTGRVEAAGLPPGEVSVRFHLLPSAVLVVEEASLGFADGTIAVSGLAVDPAAPAFETVLRIENIDLAEVFDLVGVEGLSGSGRLKGTIPLQFTGGGLRIADAVLNAGGPGVLRFKGDEVPKAIRDAGEYAQLTLDALRNFHYESLSREIDKSAAGEGTIMARLHGHNPDILEGRPFIFNIRLESDFDRLSALVLDGMTAAQALLRRAVTAVP